ncbi:MAG: TRAP transporter small permease [Proteobacteria bacterium]|nr:TRAP transporter small permease [Pseudomonadota bacterium]
MARLADRVALGLALFGVCVLGLATLALMADISMRRTIGVSITGIVDVTQLAQMFCVALAMPMAFLRESHVGVEFITDPLPPRALAAVKAFAHLVGAGFMAAIAWYSLKQTGIQVGQGDKSQTLGWPVAVYWAPLVAGAALSAAASALLAVRDIAKIGAP